MKNINLGIISGSNTKFSELTLKELYVCMVESDNFDLGVKNKIKVTVLSLN